MFFLLLLVSLLTDAGPSPATLTVKHGESLSYPAMARMARVQGEVVVNVQLNDRGEVVSSKIERGHPMLIQAADDNVKHWVFNGPIAAGDTVSITYEFRLEGVAKSEGPDYATRISFDFPPDRIMVTSTILPPEPGDVVPNKKK